jgi:error-prone DNA polymerase
VRIEKIDWIDQKSTTQPFFEASYAASGSRLPPQKGLSFSHLDGMSPQEAQSREKVAEEVAEELYGFPRHLTIHSGGFTLSAHPIIETVPIEPARMEQRTIVQWDKEDLDIVGLLKVDLLSLGMLTAIRKTLEFIPGMSLASIPAEDRATYEMIQKADTVGTFQIESRAQMSMLPRLKPKTFYDLVVQVAIVRPGPIQGDMVHPYLRRRRGEEKIDMPHPALEPILRKTLGVPLFQEQVMKMAMVLGDFTPGEADRLRRAIAAWRSSGEIDRLGKLLMERLLSKGLPQEFVDRIFRQIQGFADYGFPESHAASFALIAYASCFLKCHYPTEFLCGMINSQPLGFYSNHTLVEDAKRHGVRVFPVHPQYSDWDCRIENGGVRLGFRIVHGLSQKSVEKLMQERNQKSFSSLEDFLSRTELHPSVLESLALTGAFETFGISPRDALWKILSFSNRLLKKHHEQQGQLSLFALNPEAWNPSEKKSSFENPQFRNLSPAEVIHADYATYGLSTRAHPMKVLRNYETHLPRTTSETLRKSGRNGLTYSIAGMIIVRQRPPTAKGTCFATLEDEHGFVDLVLFPGVFEQYEDLFWNQSFLIVKGKLQIDGYAQSVIVQSLKPLWTDQGDR